MNRRTRPLNKLETTILNNIVYIAVAVVIGFGSLMVTVIMSNAKTSAKLDRVDTVLQKLYVPQVTFTIYKLEQEYKQYKILNETKSRDDSICSKLKQFEIKMNDIIADLNRLLRIHTRSVTAEQLEKWQDSTFIQSENNIKNKWIIPYTYYDWYNSLNFKQIKKL